MNIEADTSAALAAANGGGAHAAPAQPRRTFAAEAHHIMATAWHAIGQFLPYAEQAALNKQAAEGIELFMQAIGRGAEARDLELVLVQLRHIAGSLPQPLPAPAADGSEAM